MTLHQEIVQGTGPVGQPCCQACDDGEGHCAFPQYGAAPHTCFYKLGKPIGGSEELGAALWPANFELDPDTGPWTGYPRAGVYTHCLACGAPGNKEVAN